MRMAHLWPLPFILQLKINEIVLPANKSIANRSPCFAQMSPLVQRETKKTEKFILLRFFCDVRLVNCKFTLKTCAHRAFRPTEFNYNDFNRLSWMILLAQRKNTQILNRHCRASDTIYTSPASTANVATKHNQMVSQFSHTCFDSTTKAKLNGIFIKLLNAHQRRRSRCPSFKYVLPTQKCPRNRCGLANYII